MNILKGTLFFIGLFVLSRLVPHPPNFTPLIAAVIFLPFISKDKLENALVVIKDMSSGKEDFVNIDNNFEFLLNQLKVEPNAEK